MLKSKALVMLSGGLDSATCLYWSKVKFAEVSAITFNYYKRLRGEKKATIELAKSANVTNFFEINIPFIKEPDDFFNSHFSRLNFDDPRWLSYIPARNMLFYSIAAYYAEFLNIKYIIGGHNSHDKVFFRDATKPYIRKLNSLFKQGCLLCDDNPYKIILPLATMKRKNIINLALKLKVPVELTWSCHSKGKIHCGQCYACKQRLDGFNSLGLKDPVFLYS
jgi:7-cyano-7-deazaguanine synthase